MKPETKEPTKIKKCPKCGGNDFYAEEITSYSASFDEDGTLDLFHGEAGGLNGAIICKYCDYRIEEDDQDFELNFN